MLGKSLFDAGEYRRAAHALRGAASGAPLFVGLRARYLAGERRAEEELVELAGPLGKAEVANEELPALDAELARLRAGGGENGADPFLAYLHGVVLRALERADEAARALADSVRAFPCNWLAWRELVPLAGEAEQIEALALPPHFARQAFEAAACLEGQRNERGLALYESLGALFPRSSTVACAMATAYYNLRAFDEAQVRFADLQAKDPHMVEGTDTYSNILYVTEQWATLSHLAHRAVRTDKYRPETCCVVGNYYSLRAEHEKAVVYFRRALKLDRKYLSAWTLMGHEYVEMKNTPAAIDAYRRAVDINPRDYRAWYGLGQTYEILHMPYYSLYYYRRATQLRPQDARMWCAMGQCYESEQLGLREHAVRCYRRALDNNEGEGIALAKLAKLHQAMGDEGEAAEYHRKVLRSLNVRALPGEHGAGADGAGMDLGADAAVGPLGAVLGGGGSGGSGGGAQGGGVGGARERSDGDGGDGDGAPGGAPGGQDAVDALLFLADHSARRGHFDDALAYATRLLDYSGDAKETAKAILREVGELRQAGAQGAV